MSNTEMSNTEMSNSEMSNSEMSNSGASSLPGVQATPGLASTADADHIEFHDREVRDEHANHIGRVSDVIYDEAAGTVDWLVVDLGLLSSQHIVPAATAYRAEDGSIVVPYEKQTVKHSPRAPKDHVLTREDTSELARYYGLELIR